MERHALQTQIKQGLNLDGSPVYCRFPARTKWLIRENFIDSKLVDWSHCTAYSYYLTKMPRRTVYLVFSSYHLESASSTFGHTLLRMSNNTVNETSSELMDMGINFAAEVDTSNPLSYALKGLFGGFKAKFSIMPYFYKIREYADYESRDLWSYQLLLTSEQIEQLIDHIWELLHVDFSYYYIDENCSFQLLALLDAINPDWQLASNLKPYVVPIDSVRVVLNEPNLVGDIQYRPSLRTQLDGQINELSERELEVFWQLATQPEENKKWPQLAALEEARVLETISKYLDYSYKDDIVKGTEKVVAWKHKLLSRRSRLDIPSGFKASPLKEAEQPHRSHPTARTGMSMGQEYGLRYWGFDFRLGHDLSDPAYGYFSSAEIEFLKAKLRVYPGQQRLELDSLDLLNLSYLQPWRYNDLKLSYKVRFAYESRYQQGTSHGTPLGYMGVGVSWESPQIGLFFPMAVAQLQNDDSGSFAAQPGVLLGWRWVSPQTWALLAEDQFLHFRNRWERTTSLEWRYYLSKTSSVGMMAKREVDSWQEQLVWYQYF